MSHAVNFSLAIKTAAGTEPVTAAEAKTHMRITFADDDTYIATLIKAARRAAEKRTRRALVTQTWYLYFDKFPQVIYVPLPPLVSVTAITYEDENSDNQTLSSSKYQVDITPTVGRILIEPSESWPNTEVGRAQAVRVEYVAGYGAAAAVPDDIKQAILMLVNHWYVPGRAPVVTGTSLAPVPDTVDRILASYKVARF